MLGGFGYRFLVVLRNEPNFGAAPIVFGGQDQLFGIEAVLKGILAGFQFSLLGTWTGRALGVGAINLSASWPWGY